MTINDHQPLIETLPMSLGAPISDEPDNPAAIEIPLQIALPNGQTLYAAVALGGLPFRGQQQIAERIAAAWNAFVGIATEKIATPSQHQATINIIELALKHGASSYRNRADTQHPAYGFTEERLQAFAHALLAACRKCPACGHSTT